MINTNNFICIILYNIFLYYILCNMINIYENKTKIRNNKYINNYNKKNKCNKIIFNINIYTKVIISYNILILLNFLYIIFGERYEYIYKKVLNKELIECSICYEKIIYKGYNIENCNCRDIYYHDTCINKWLLINNSCPYCRYKIKI